MSASFTNDRLAERNVFHAKRRSPTSRKIKMAGNRFPPEKMILNLIDKELNEMS